MLINISLECGEKNLVHPLHYFPVFFYPIAFSFFILFSQLCSESLILLLCKRSEIGSYINSFDVFRVFFIPVFYSYAILRFYRAQKKESVSITFGPGSFLFPIL